MQMPFAAVHEPSGLRVSCGNLSFSSTDGKERNCKTPRLKAGIFHATNPEGNKSTGRSFDLHGKTPFLLFFFQKSSQMFRAQWGHDEILEATWKPQSHEILAEEQITVEVCLSTHE